MSDAGEIDFPDELWAFHRVPKKDRAIVWKWEREVEHGSGWPHWLTLRKEQRAAIAAWNRRTSIVKEWGIDSRLYKTLLLQGGNRRGSYFHVLRIDWAAGKEAVKRAFGEWVETDSAGMLPFAKPDKGGKKEPFKWLVDLAVFRACQRGINRRDGLKIMAKLFKATGVVKGWEKHFSYWSNAKNTYTPRRLKRSEIERICLADDRQFFLECLIPPALRAQLRDTE